jgi:hypothetical protein
MTKISILKLNKAQRRIDFLIDKMEKDLKPLIGFEFSLMHQSEVGFVICDSKNYHEAELAKCIKFVNTGETLTYEAFLKISK